MRLLINIFFFAFNIAYHVSFSQDTIRLKIKVKTPPKFMNQLRLADGYSSPNNARADLFNKAGSQAQGVAIPNNYVGSQIPPDGQDSYFGICTYNGKVSFSVGDQMKYGVSNTQFNDIGFIQALLPSALTKKEYFVSYKVSLADHSGFATSGWGVYFSEKQITDSINFSTAITPHLSVPDMVKDKMSWTELKFKYKPTGKEKYIVIGCFKKDYTKQETPGGRDFALSKAYYYVTDIKFIEIPEDRDKDGVWDIKDRCPDVFGLAELKGCPDTDGDGIANIDDACPNVKGLLVFKGCPDTDGDGITDSEDKCPTAAGKLADGGCPVDESKNIQNLISTIQFEEGKEILKPSSIETLDDVASILKANTSLNITIGEFLSEGADPVKAKELSTKRANAIISYLVGKGCNPAMINYVGNSGVELGQPTDPSNTRRVEFKQ